MAGCTFRPVLYSQIPHKLHKLPPEELLEYRGSDSIEVENILASELLCDPLSPHHISPYRPPMSRFDPSQFLRHLRTDHS